MFLVLKGKREIFSNNTKIARRTKTFIFIHVNRNYCYIHQNIQCRFFKNTKIKKKKRIIMLQASKKSKERVKTFIEKIIKKRCKKIKNNDTQ